MTICEKCEGLVNREVGRTHFNRKDGTVNLQLHLTCPCGLTNVYQNQVQ